MAPPEPVIGLFLIVALINITSPDLEEVFSIKAYIWSSDVIRFTHNALLYYCLYSYYLMLFSTLCERKSQFGIAHLHSCFRWNYYFCLYLEKIYLDFSFWFYYISLSTTFLLYNWNTVRDQSTLFKYQSLKYTGCGVYHLSLIYDLWLSISLENTFHRR